MVIRRLQKSKATQRVERLIFDVILEAEWKCSGTFENRVAGIPLSCRSFSVLAQSALKVGRVEGVNAIFD